MAHFTDILVKKNIISSDELRKLRAETRAKPRELEETLMARGIFLFRNSHLANASERCLT